MATELSAAIVGLLKEAFAYGFGSPETYNDTLLNSADEAWAKHEADFTKAAAALAAPPVEQQAAPCEICKGRGFIDHADTEARTRNAGKWGRCLACRPYEIAAQAAQPAAQAEPNMRAICEALGFDPTNHHNAAKCPYCRPTEPSQDAERLDFLDAFLRQAGGGVSLSGAGPVRQIIDAARAAQAQGGSNG